ncbi:MAG: MBL fold metallo-hydrolase [Bacilli bacterium]|nr:MBL fold metallo-hydrolase [Bacilli bacterium]
MLFVRYRLSNKRLAFLSLLLACIGVGLSFINISTNRNECKGVVAESKENYYIFDSFGEKFYISEKNNQKEVGDWLFIKGKQEELDFTTLESEFDFKEYLNKSGVYKRFTVEYEKTTFKTPIRTKKVRNNFLSHFDEDTRDLYSSILFSNSLNGELTSSLRYINISRLISFGGIYIYSFMKMIEAILQKFMKEKTSKIISTSILCFYSIFTFPRFTVIRILFLNILRLFNKYKFNGKFSSGTIIGFSGLIFLSLNARLANSDSFIIGYLIPINNLLFSGIIGRLKGIRKRIIPLVWLYFLFLPFELNFNNCTNSISFYAQILLSPFFILSGFIGFLCFFKIPIYPVANLFTNVIIFLSKGLSFISFSINIPQFSSYFIPIYYFGYYLLMYYSQIRFIPIVRFLKISYASVLCLYVLPIKNAITQEVSFINVGQGDCCLIRDGNNTVLIDTGGLAYKDLATSSLIPYFKRKRLYNIDCVFLTHDDYDHCGALDSLKEHFKVKNVIRKYDLFPIKIGKITFNNYNIFSYNSSEENDNSLVIGFSICKLNFLVTGDAPIEIENKIMEKYSNIPCDILKVGHHGSKTSTSDSFVKYLSPKEAVISCGKNNKYGHPNDSVIKILNNNGVVIKRTDILGTITYSNYKFL